MLLSAALLLVSCGDAGGTAEDGEEVRQPSQTGQEQFDELLSKIRIEATLYGGLGVRIVLSSDTVQVRASWYGVDEPVLYVDHCVLQNVYGGVEGEPPTQEKHCTNLTDYQTCTFSEDGRRAECVFTWGVGYDRRDGEGQNRLPELWSIVPSNNATLGGNYQGAQATIPLASVKDCVVYYDETSLPAPGSPLPVVEGTEIRWSGATGISELLAKKYPGRALVRQAKTVQNRALPEYDIFADLCVDQEVLVGPDGQFHVELTPELLSACPAGMPLEFYGGVVRQIEPDGFAAGSSIRYGNLGYPVKLGLQ